MKRVNELAVDPKLSQLISHLTMQVLVMCWIADTNRELSIWRITIIISIYKLLSISFDHYVSYTYLPLNALMGYSILIIIQV